jgi:hypothetical protein
LTENDGCALLPSSRFKWLPGIQKGEMLSFRGVRRLHGDAGDACVASKYALLFALKHVFFRFVVLIGSESESAGNAPGRFFGTNVSR